MGRCKSLSQIFEKSDTHMNFSGVDLRCYAPVPSGRPGGLRCESSGSLSVRYPGYNNSENAAMRSPRRGNSDHKVQAVCCYPVSFCGASEETIMIHHVYGDRVSSTDEEEEHELCRLVSSGRSDTPHAVSVHKQFAPLTPFGLEE